MPSVLVTGAAGFIGYHCCAALRAQGWDVVGLDAMTDYYDVALKEARLAQLEGVQGGQFTFVRGHVETRDLLMDLFAQHRFDLVIHLAAQAGVRYSIDNPRAYLDSNITGTFELLEAARAHPPRHMLLASTSSAYGANTVMPYLETARADHQMSFYAATKKATEAMAHSYAHLYGLPVTMFRFFTVYGPWGRPDMAPYKFTRAILAGETIDVYNHGQVSRDFTYIDDLVAAIMGLMAAVPATPDAAGTPVLPGDSLSPVAPFRIVNIGNANPVPLLDFIAAIEAATEQAACQNLLPIQPGDVPDTWADTALLEHLTGAVPATPIGAGMVRFVDWYRQYYRV